MTSRPNTVILNSGFEVPDALVFKKWEVNHEYTKNLVIKNVQIRLQKLQYTAPSATSPFSIPCPPQLAQISAGTNLIIPVTFRPRKQKEFEDEMHFVTVEGVKFTVPIRATIPKPSLIFPERLQFGVVPVGIPQQKTFTLKNASDLTTVWRINCPSNFTVSPQFGELEPKKACEVTVLFTALEAVVYESDMVIKSDSGEIASFSMVLEGCGKYPFLMLRPAQEAKFANRTISWDKITEPKLMFPDTLVSDSSQMQFVLENPTVVPAHVSVRHIVPVAQTKSNFRLNIKSIVIPPKKSVDVTATFQPIHVNEESTEYFEISTVKGNTIRMACQGKCLGPEVVASVQTFKFSPTFVNTPSTKTFTLTNKSSVAVPFKFQAEIGTVFNFEPSSGTLQANETRPVTVTFTPTFGGHYFRTIHCVIQHHQPLSFECMGTGHVAATESVSAFLPYPITEQHIALHRKRAAIGLGHYGPEQLRDMIARKNIAVDANGDFTFVLPRDDSTLKFQPTNVRNPVTPKAVGDKAARQLSQQQPPASRSGALTASPSVASKVDANSRPAIPSTVSQTLTAMSDFFTISASSIDFGTATVRKGKVAAPITRAVTLTNHTATTVTCSWTCTYSSQMPFYVDASQAEIAAGESRSFTINFSPDTADRFFQAEAECYVTFSEMMKEENVGDELFCIPQSFSVAVAGSTFAQVAPAPPNVLFSAVELLFPVTTPNTATFETTVLRNAGQSSVKFDFVVNDDYLFDVIPSSGILAPNQEVLLLFTALSKEPGPFAYTASCVFNNDQEHPKFITLSGVAENPSLSIENEGLLYFAPTALGASSTVTHSIRNTSGLKLNFEWRLSADTAKVAQVEPITGVLLPYETRSQTWTFTPATGKPFAAKATCAFSAVSKPSTFSLPHKPKTREGQRVTYEDEFSDSRPMSMNRDKDRKSSKTANGGKEWKKSTLIMTGQGVGGELTTSQQVVDFETVVAGTTVTRDIVLQNASLAPVKFILSHTGDPNLLRFDTSEGLLQPRSQQRLALTISPSQEGAGSITVHYQLLTGHAETSLAGKSSFALCDVQYKCVWPRLAVSHVASQGICKERLWRYFNLAHLNKVLNPKAFKEHAMEPMDVRFPTAVVNSSDTTVKIQLTNPCICDVEWSIIFPYDGEYKPEVWAASQNLTEQEQRNARLQANKTFAVSPQRGKLAPGQSCVVDFTNKHGVVGHENVPVILRVTNRPDVTLNLISQVLAPNTPFLELLDETHDFDSVPIGVAEVPTQFYTLYNRGDAAAMFELDCSDVDAVNEANHDFTIFECGKLNGVVAAGSSLVLPWRFHPLEAKTYTARVVVKPSDDTSFEPTTITFRGTGVFPVPVSPASSHFQAPSAKRHGNSKPQTCIPRDPRITFPCQLAQLSTDGINFGELPAFGVARRLVFVNNKTADHAIAFQWQLGMLSKVLTVIPMSGVVEAGETKVCKVVFKACDGPAVYDYEVACLVSDETEWKQYEKALATAAKTRQQLNDEFTYTDKGRTGPARAGGYVIPENPSGVRGSMVPVGSFPDLDRSVGPTPILAKFLSSWRADKPFEAEPDYDADMRVATQTLALDSDLRAKKYTALPPIKVMPNARVENPVRPAKPQEFFVNIKCTTGGVVASAQDFVLRANSLDICNHAYETPRLWSEENGESLAVPEILQNILEDIIYDPAFHAAIEETAELPIPYFGQFRSSRPADSTSRSTSAAGSRPTSRRGNNFESDHVQPSAFLTAEADDHQSGRSVPNPSMLDDADLLFTAEFQKLAEEIMDASLANILSEAESGEFSITHRSRVVAHTIRPRT